MTCAFLSPLAPCSQSNFALSWCAVHSDVLDTCMRITLQSSPTWIDIKGKTPRRVLDLGCGVRSSSFRALLALVSDRQGCEQNGIWAIEAARMWPDAEFVGFDLVNIQIPLNCVEKSVAQRIVWQHGNLYVSCCAASSRLVVTWCVLA